jgi:hypothetical protein
VYPILLRRYSLGGVATRSYDVVGYTTYEVQATTTTGETVTFYPNAFLAEYLVVAGGGAGGWSGNFAPGGGGGGAGGYLASADAVAMAVVTGQAYPVIVGGGGSWCCMLNKVLLVRMDQIHSLVLFFQQAVAAVVAYS